MKVAIKWPPSYFDPLPFRRDPVPFGASSFVIAAALIFAACGDVDTTHGDYASDSKELGGGPLEIADRLEVTPRLARPGQTVSASVSYSNDSPSAVEIDEAMIIARHVHSGLEVALAPTLGPSKISAGESVELPAEHTFAADAPRGIWAFRAMYTTSDGAEHVSRRSVLVGVIGRAVVDEGPSDDPEPNPFDASFHDARGNEWWVEVEVDASLPLAGVDARADDSEWLSLEPTDWGSWALSFFVEEGCLVQFRATSTCGEEALSGRYLWPDAVLVDPDDPGDDPSDPGDDPSDPGDDPGDPGDDPSDPGDDPSDPGDDPSDPGDDPLPPGSTPWLQTQGNQIVGPNGDIWIGRGFNIHDTRSCNACTWTQPNVDEVKRRIDEAVDVWGADFLRLNLESYGSSGGRVHWENVTQDSQFLDDVIEIVEHIGTKPGAYVLVSLWHDPTFNSLGWPTAATIPVWELLATELRDMSHVMFGLVNEPQHNWDGGQDHQVWEAMNDVVAAIRNVQDSIGANRNIIAVQGTRGWARCVNYYVDNPITAGGGENIVYETHPYNSVGELYGLYEQAAETIPVIIGEFGPFAGMNTQDAEQMMERAEARGIPYLAWTFHMRCPPNLLVDHSGGGCGVGMPLEPTAWGQQLMDRLSSPP